MNSSVVVVDDETHWIEFARQAFANKGIQLIQFSTLQTASAFLAAKGALALLVNAHLVIEWEELRALRSSNKVSKILALANSRSPSLAMQAFRHGSDYTEKPFSLDGLNALISSLLVNPKEPHPHAERLEVVSSVHGLIVEDLPEWQQIFRRILADISYLTLTVVSSYKEAIKALDQHSFHLIITDLRLIDEDSHNIDGFVLLKRLYESENNAVIILTSGFASLELIREAKLNYQAVDFFLKSPDSGQFEYEQFRNCVREIVDSLVRDYPVHSGQ